MLYRADVNSATSSESVNVWPEKSVLFIRSRDPPPGGGGGPGEGSAKIVKKSLFSLAHLLVPKLDPYCQNKGDKFNFR